MSYAMTRKRMRRRPYRELCAACCTPVAQCGDARTLYLREHGRDIDFNLSALCHHTRGIHSREARPKACMLAKAPVRPIPQVTRHYRWHHIATSYTADCRI